ncbi:MAG: hypothetical protein K5931_08170 [Lachnospiraceae bacterium]|nr:hypothetical protein [Lachnospiraceae bacterium]
MLKGVYRGRKKDGSEYFRSSITYKNKHISLGGFRSEEEANRAYNEAGDVLYGKSGLEDYNENFVIPFDKYISLVNFRDNNMYIKNPIYLMNTYIEYHFSNEIVFKFDIEDLFFYSVHRIQGRKGHYFVSDYGMQLNLKHRYGIKNHAVLNRDYRFINGDVYDYRYENIEILSSYKGVILQTLKGRAFYKTMILVRGNYLVGNYESQIEAAIAYNKAADIIMEKIPEKKYELNYIDSLSASEYAQIYTDVKISQKIYAIKEQEKV